MTVIPAIPTPIISPNNLLFCSRSEDVLFASARTIRYDIYRLETDPNPILSIVPGELVPASVFVGTDSSFYIAAITSPQCAGIKQLVTYSIFSDSVNAGNDIVSCVGVTSSLSATAPRSGQTGRWEVNPNITFSNRNIPNGTVTASNVGVYELVWVVSSPQCPDKTDKVTFTVSGFNPIQATTDIIACDQTIEIPYFASPNVQVALYPNANGTNPITVVNSGQPIIVTQTAEQERYYLGYVNAECRTPLKEINVTRSVQPIVNFAENYKVCQLLNTSIVVRNPIVNSGLQPLKLGTFSSNTSGVIIDWNSSGAFLTISGLQLNNFYTIRYEYSIGNCPPALGSFVIDTYGNPPIPEENLELNACTANYVLTLPKGTLGNSVFLDGVTDGSVASNNTGVFPLTLTRPVTVFNYGYFNTECGRGPSRQITIRLSNPFQNFKKLPDVITSLGTSVRLSTDAAITGYQYSWTNIETGSTINILNANIRPDQSTTYILKVISPEDCEYYDTINVTVNSNFDLPNMFTPNGNGQNETFGIASKTNITTPYELTIVNKYGQVVFSKSGQYISWNGDLSNGNPAPQDTYYYRIKFTEGLDDKIGSVQLVR
jgi:gliding motility-associated-like protein